MLFRWFSVDQSDPLERHRGQILIGLSTLTILALLTRVVPVDSNESSLLLFVSILLLFACCAAIWLAWKGHVTEGATLYLTSLLLRVGMPLNGGLTLSPNLGAELLIVIVIAYATLGSKSALVLGILVSSLLGLLRLYVPVGAQVDTPWISSLLPFLAGAVFAWIGEPRSLSIGEEKKMMTAIVNNIQRIEPAFDMIEARLDRLNRSEKENLTAHGVADIEAIERIIRSADAQAKTTFHLIEVQHLPDAISPQNFDPADLMYGLINRFDDDAIAKNVRLSYVLDPHVGSTIYQDAYRIREAVAAILENALTYTEHGTIAIRLSLQGSSLCAISIRDTGIGMPDHRIETILRALENGEQAPNHHQRGHGKGLALAYQSMQRLGGSLKVESKLGVGTTVFLKFPIHLQIRKSSRSFF